MFWLFLGFQLSNVLEMPTEINSSTDNGFAVDSVTLVFR